MALPASGAISLLDIQSTMGGGATNIAIGNYYRGGANVPNITENNAIPTTGQISFSNFYSTYGRVTSNHTLGVGTRDEGAKPVVTYYGYNSALSMGSLSPTTFSSIYGTLTILRCEWDNNPDNLSFVVSNNNNTHFVFYEIVINGTTFTRSSATFTDASPNGLWSWSGVSNPFGTSGNITLTVRRYG